MTEAGAVPKKMNTNKPINVLASGDIRKSIEETSEAVCDILGRHCGPTAGFATWPNYYSVGVSSTDITDMEFSKDGISIVRRIKFPENSFAEKFMHSVGYVGERVDNACNDGTTTAMLLFCKILQKLVSNSAVSEAAENDPMLVVAALNDILAKLKACISDNKLEISDFKTLFENQKTEELASHPQEAKRSHRYFLAYFQAMIASKGNVDLSQALGEIADEIPLEEFFGQFLMTHSVTETEKPLELVWQDHDVEFRSSFIDRNLFNRKLKTSYYREGVTLLVSEDALIKDTPVANRLTSHIKTVLTHEKKLLAEKEAPPLKNPKEEILDPGEKQAVEQAAAYLEEQALRQAAYLIDVLSTTDLVIISQNIEGPLIREITEFNNHRRSIGSTNFIVPLILDAQRAQAVGIYLTVIRGLAGGIPNLSMAWHDISQCFIRNVTVEHVNSVTARISNLYEKKDDSIYTSPYQSFIDTGSSNEVFDKIVSELKTAIVAHYQQHRDSAVRQESVTEYLSAYRQALCKRWCTLEVGGMTHDIRAQLSVTQDAYGAVASTLEKGFILGGFFKMYRGIRQEIQRRDQEDEYKLSKSRVYDECLKCFDSALENVLMTSLGTKDVAVIRQAVSYSSVFSDGEADPRIKHPVYVFPEGLEGKSSVKVIENLPDALRNGAFLVQPVQGYYELITRLRELITRYSVTTTYLNTNP